MPDRKWFFTINKDLNIAYFFYVILDEVVFEDIDNEVFKNRVIYNWSQKTLKGTLGKDLVWIKNPMKYLEL